MKKAVGDLMRLKLGVPAVLCIVALAGYGALNALDSSMSRSEDEQRERRVLERAAQYKAAREQMTGGQPLSRPPASSRAPAIGAKVAPLVLVSVGGQPRTLSWSAGKNRNRVTVLVFVSAGCETSNAYDERLATLAARCAEQKVTFLAINIDSPQAKPAPPRAWKFPVLRDPEARASLSLGATRTPEAFVIDRAGRLRYRGAIDNSSDTNEQPVRDHYLQDALDQVLAGKALGEPTIEPFGCPIWRGE